MSWMCLRFQRQRLRGIRAWTRLYWQILWEWFQGLIQRLMAPSRGIRSKWCRIWCEISLLTPATSNGIALRGYSIWLKSASRERSWLGTIISLWPKIESWILCFSSSATILRQQATWDGFSGTWLKTNFSLKNYRELASKPSHEKHRR